MPHTPRSAPGLESRVSPRVAAGMPGSCPSRVACRSAVRVPKASSPWQPSRPDPPCVRAFRAKGWTSPRLSRSYKGNHALPSVRCSTCCRYLCRHRRVLLPARLLSHSTTSTHPLGPSGAVRAPHFPPRPRAHRSKRSCGRRCRSASPAELTAGLPTVNSGSNQPLADPSPSSHSSPADRAAGIRQARHLPMAKGHIARFSIFPRFFLQSKGIYVISKSFLGTSV
jgi:hypothetical protein